MEKFEIVYRSSFREVYLYLLKLTKDEHLAEELTAETFFRAINRLDKFRGDSSMKSYLIQIGKNAYFDYLRERKKFSDEEIDLMTSEAEVEATVIDEESKNLLYEALNELDTIDQNIVIWRSFDQLSFDAIGALDEKTANWACVRVHRAKKKFRLILT
mgnify:FL=1